MTEESFKNKLVLNHPCKKCERIIHIGDCVLTEEGAYHIDCFKKINFEEGKSKTQKEILEMIEEVDIELLFTAVRDKKGDMHPLSKEVMELISIWWGQKKKELTKKIKDTGK